MEAATQTPCSIDIELKDIDDKTNTSHVTQVNMEHFGRRLRSLPNTPQSISSTSQSWLSSHPSCSQETLSWGEHSQQGDRPIYFAEEREPFLPFSPEQVLIAPLHVDDTNQLPHAQSERQNILANNRMGEADQVDLPIAMIDFFSNRSQAAQISPTLDKEHLDNLLLNDLSTIMEMSECGDSKFCLCHHGHSLSMSQPSTPLVQPITQSKTHFPSPSVITDYTDPERPFACDICHRKYTRPQDCTRHIKSAHIKIKYFSCHQIGCEGRFCRSDVLKRHLRCVHHLSNE